jgi:carbon monoxide dehydrogenase subunit G
MENVSIKLELGIDAQRFVQQVRLNNTNIEEQIAKGVELALSDIGDGDNFVQLVRETTKAQLLNIVNRAVLSYHTQNEIEKAVASKLGKKLEEYADKLAEKIVGSLQ